MKCLLLKQTYCEAELRNKRHPREWCCYHDGKGQCAYNKIAREEKLLKNNELSMKEK